MSGRVADFSRLRYIKAANLRGGGVSLAGFEVQDAFGSRLGRLAGVIVDPVTKRLRYLVVGSWQGIASDSGVLPLFGARLDAGNRAVVLFELDRPTA